MINFNHANVVNAAKLTPEIASMPVNWRSKTLHNQPQIIAYNYNNIIILIKIHNIVSCDNLIRTGKLP